MAKNKNIKGILVLLALVGLYFATKRKQHSSGAMFRTNPGGDPGAPESEPEVNKPLTRPATPTELFTEVAPPAAAAESLEITEIDFFESAEDDEEIEDVL